MLLLQPSPADRERAAPHGDGPPTPSLHLLCAVMGSHTIERHGRTLVLDPDCYLLVNDAPPAPSFAAAEGALVRLQFGSAQLAAAGMGLPHVLERLCLIEEPAASLLLRARREFTAAQRSSDGGSLDELLRSLVADELRLQRRAQTIDCVKPSTRRELVRRVLLANDFILSNHAAPIRIDDVAHAAHLSRFHLTRLFGQLLGVTPHALLLNKRLATAKRLLADGRADMSQVAEMSGFGSRWSLFRRLQQGSSRPAAARREVPLHPANQLAASD